MPSHDETSLVAPSDRGLYCPAGDFHIDPCKKVDRALITHAHSDHARPGARRYLTAAEGVDVLRIRLGRTASVTGTPYGAATDVNGVRVSFHPAGHVLGSAQIRLEKGGRVTVVSGDYKLQPDPTCAAFEPVRCDTFITESTFGLPIYVWPPAERTFAEMNEWWRGNQAQGRTSVILAYALGKAQRILAGLDASLGPLLVHPLVHEFFPAYRAAGVRLPHCERIAAFRLRVSRGQALIVAPPQALGTRTIKKFGPLSMAMASGWTSVRGPRRGRTLDRGFTLSDHADWPGLLTAIRESGAESVGVTHGHTRTLTRYLNETGRRAFILPSPYSGEPAEASAADAPSDSSGAPPSEG